MNAAIFIRYQSFFLFIKGMNKYSIFNWNRSMILIFINCEFIFIIIKNGIRKEFRITNVFQYFSFLF